ncbi:magnesium-translocating P-type ATPase [Actinomadura barringtoniae]|uniref:Magnesium-transporting ATPase, P-type 1 n=1 Tax=Actinomadura barringtoniae TaxID=1427535 RepID=A0A939T8R1_9ACTN|nr:magnesium-translocating P-type ATPase [Actinomadura barringtoniae]MBO2453429.1 magnesium-translocating P-type ATPase [Actinomadura barringtoniae]
MAWAPESLPQEAAPVEPRPLDQVSRPGAAMAAAELLASAERPPFAVLRRWESSPRGLDEREAQDRLLRRGEDGPPGLNGRAGRLLRAVAAPFVMVLIFLSAVSALAGDFRGAALICLLATFSGALRFHQEYRSDRAAAALRAIVTTTATVLRRATPDADPVPREVPLEHVVEGDLVLLGPGDVVPADLRLLSSSDLTVNQAVVTGESLPAGKHASWTTVPEPRWTPPDPFEHPHLCFMGTTVVSGTGTAVAVATGTATYFGATSRDVPSRPPSETTFDRGVRTVSWALVAAMLAALPVVLTVSGFLRGDWAQALLLAIAVAVAVTPEMLPLVVTALLVRGATRLLRREVIVKRLTAVHNLGAMDTLCIDKTGTLTEERVSLVCHFDPLGRTDDDVLHWARANALWSVELTGGLVGDAIDEALLENADLDGSGDRLDELTGIEVIPFDFTRRRASVLLRPDDPRSRLEERDVLVTKGSVEDVVNLCARVRTGTGDYPLDATERMRLLDIGDRWAADGVRLLAVATAERPTGRPSLTPADERDLTFVGFVGFRDRLEPAAAPAVEALRRRGLDLVMITGDHPLVARRICRDAGLRVSQVVVGRDLAGLDDAELGRLACSGTVFARVGPPQKARIVRALQGAGRTVGYLGDGVNDALALRAADVGISIKDAADLARQSADVVLVRKDLRLLEETILAGRRTFANTVKYIKIALTSNFGNVASMLAASAMLPFLPMLPLQVLVQNMCFDLSQLALVYDRVDESELQGPRTFDPRDLARFIGLIGPVGALFDLMAFGMFRLVVDVHGNPAGQALFHTAWFAENLLAQGLAMLLLRSRGRGSPRPAWPVLLAAGGLSLSGLLLPFTPVAGLLGLRPLPLEAFPLLAVTLTGYGLATIGIRRVYQRLFGRWL